MNDRLQQILEIRSRLGLRLGAVAEIQELKARMGNEDVSDLSKADLERQVESIIQQERDHEAEISRDISTLDNLAESKLSQEEAEGLAQCVTAVADLEKWENVTSPSPRGFLCPWLLKAICLLTVALRNSSGRPLYDAAERCVELLGHHCNLVESILRDVSTDDESFVQQMDETLGRLEITDEVIDLVALRASLAEPVSLQTAIAQRRIATFLRNRQMRDDFAVRLENSIQKIEFDSLIANAEKLGHEVTLSEQTTALLQILNDQTNRILAESKVSEAKRQLAQLLNRLLSDRTESLPSSEARIVWSDAFGQDLSDHICGYDEERGLAWLFTLAVLMLAVKAYDAIGDRPRARYFAEKFGENDLISHRVWQNSGFDVPWSERGEELARKLRAEQHNLVSQTSKVFEELKVAEISSVDAKQIQQALRAMPQALVDEMLRRTTLPQVSSELVVKSLERQLGDTWNALTPVAKCSLVTAECLLKIPADLDHSGTSSLYWKALEVELKEKLFRKFRLAPPRIEGSGLVKLEATFAALLCERDWGKARSLLTLLSSVCVLQDASQGKGRLYSLFRQHLQKEERHLVEHPERLNFDRWIRQIKEIRNAGMHETYISYEDAAATPDTVIDALKTLFPHKSNR